MIPELISSFTMQVDRKKEEWCQNFTLSLVHQSRFLEIPNYYTNSGSMVGDASELGRQIFSIAANMKRSVEMEQSPNGASRTEAW
jgi:hypothetical protein